MPVLGRGALGLLLILGSSDAFLPVPSQKGCVLNPAALSGPLSQGPVEAGKGSFTCRPSRSTALASTVMDSTPSDVTDVEESMPADMSPEVISSASSDRKGLSDSKNEIKDELIELVSGGFLTNSARKRALVSELLLKLEALNPTEAPAYSPLLNGPWSFLYTGGVSPGMLGLQLVAALSNSARGAIEIKDTTLLLSRAQPRVEVSTTVSVFGRENTFKIRTNLEPESDLRLKETYVEAVTGTLRLPLPRQGIFERSLVISYLDDDLLIVRDSFGAPDILIRKDKNFYTPFAGVPSASDDDAAPGAG